MTGGRDLTFTSAVELARLYRARKVSPLEVVQALIERVDAVNPKVNAIVTLAREARLQMKSPNDSSLRTSCSGPCSWTRR